VRQRKAILPVAAIVIAALAPLTSPGRHASAAASGEAGYDDGYVFAGYTDRPVEVTQVRDVPRSPTRWCVHWPLALVEITPNIAALSPDEVRRLTVEYRGELVEGAQYALLCYRTGEATPYLVTFVVFRHRDPTDGHVTTIETVEEHVRRLVTFPEPAIATSPPPERLVVGFETWFATPVPVEAQPRTAQAGHLWARAVPGARTIRYDFGDGSSTVCGAPAEPGPPGLTDDERPECTRHTYLDSFSESGAGRFTVTAAVGYDIWLTTSEEPLARWVDRREGPPAELSVLVREIQAVIR
jgi:hypothetical protein